VSAADFLSDEGLKSASPGWSAAGL